MKRIKIDFSNKWNYLLGAAFIISNILVFTIEIDLDRGKNLFWLLYLIIFWFFPILFMVIISDFRKPFFYAESDKINNLFQQLYNSAYSKNFPKKLLEEIISESDDIKFEEFERIVNRVMILYYLGLIGCLTLISM